jgi:HK97 gp10 family phage protein
MRLTVQLQGLDALSLKVRYLRDGARLGLKLGVSEAAGLFEAEAKEIVPVDTGALRDSIHTESVIDNPEEQQLAIDPDTPYAARIEFGFVGVDSLGRHYHQAAQPYMRPAFDMKQNEARQVIKDGVYEQLDSAMAGVSGRR